MKSSTTPVRIYDAKNDYTWSIPRKRIHAIVAQVNECWVANVVVPEAICRELIHLPFLEPKPTPAGYVLSICAIFMKHSAPTWLPLRMGPASQNCALSIACTDVRDGTSVTWIDHRYSDNALAEALAKLGLFQIRAKLKVEHGRDMYRHRQLSMYTLDNMIDFRLVEYPEAQSIEPTAFTDAKMFQEYYTEGTLQYGPGNSDDSCMMVDVHSCGYSHFELMSRYYGYLRTAWGNWKVDGVYRSCNGTYEWRYNGDVSMDHRG